MIGVGDADAWIHRMDKMQSKSLHRRGEVKVFCEGKQPYMVEVINDRNSEWA